MSQASDLYDYWLSTQGKGQTREEPKLAPEALELIFCRMDKESGKIEGEKSRFFYHGTAQKFKSSIEGKGLQVTEGVACFTRKVTHALENFSLMGNYSMIGSGTVDLEIEELVKKGIVSKHLSTEERAHAAFECWTKDEVRERLGLLTIWDPPEKAIALDRKEEKKHKRHFALYRVTPDKTSVERRRELAGKKGEKIFLPPKFSVAEVKPTPQLRRAVEELKKLFDSGVDIFKEKEEQKLSNILDEAVLKIESKYNILQLTENILISIMEGQLLGLVHEIALCTTRKIGFQKYATRLKSLVLPIDYLDQYRGAVLSLLEKKSLSRD